MIQGTRPPADNEASGGNSGGLRRGRACTTDCTCGRHDLAFRERKRAEMLARTATPEHRAHLARLNVPKGEATTYPTAHARVLKARGPARDYACTGDHAGPCLDLARADEWALDLDASTLRQDAEGRLFSPDPEAYSPRCRDCHFTYDLEHGGRR